jgi:hypothetical protein
VNTLRATIETIGAQMVRCDRACTGVLLDPPSGAVPRSLYLEEGTEKGSLGAAVVGMNPGQPMKGEFAHYLQNGNSYAAVTTWFAQHGRTHRYHKNIRRLLDCMDVAGPILWTELAKCQSLTAGKAPPLQTFRTWSSAFLNRELEALPTFWPILAIGRDAYSAVSFRFADRRVVGVPHPTGSKGHFAALCSDGALLPGVRAAITATRDSGAAVWLSSSVGV